MAITIGTPTSGIATSAGSSNYTLSHEVTDGTKVLVVGVCAEYQSGEGATSAKWNTTDMLVGAKINSSATCSAIFYLKNPEVGTYNVVIHDDESAGVTANSPWVYAVNLSGDVIGNSIGDTKTGSEVQTFTVQGSAGVIFDVFLGDTVATVGASSTAIWDNQTISLADKTAASYRTHTGSNITTDHNADSNFYVGVEFKQGTDFIPQIIII